ncbi:HNH endonuclease [Nitrogeniibacter mangrovi]|uniref:HNH endonuclease n=1 Tax=Nitrogeniibacter mangrovi TaxID=2016596 RepID=A0A6C1BAS3_9RHOO|nr:HNH endonuclease [Nitrogeniibacter mangrovi]QID19374.1 HNH endonuclease [Nitrogeniibacter mangrovi]
MTYKDEILRLMTQPEQPNALYYHCSAVIDPEKGLQWSVQTQWCGYADERPRREIRKGCLYHGEAQRNWLHEAGYPALLINDELDLKYFYLLGGNALILQELAEKRFAHHIEPTVCLRESGGLGFASADSLSKTQLQHAPTKTVRMEVLTRDGRRCQICGRSPAYYVDVELHVHHAIPWGKGGMTEVQNLITLCKTCHDGLEPHCDMDLVNLLHEKYPNVAFTYLEDIKRYQAWIKSQMEAVT